MQVLPSEPLNHPWTGRLSAEVEKGIIKCTKASGTAITLHAQELVVMLTLGTSFLQGSSPAEQQHSGHTRQTHTRSVPLTLNNQRAPTRKVSSCMDTWITRKSTPDRKGALEWI